MVAGAGRQDDMARLDVVQGDRGEVGAEAVGADAGRNGQGLPGGDKFEFVLEGFDWSVGNGSRVTNGSTR